MEKINETALIPDTSNTETAREKFEQARLSRRAALRKMGLTTGMAFFGMFAVDDLARLAISKMEQHKETREVAETVAKEFKNSGVAFAGTYPGPSADPDPPSPTQIGTNCASNPDYYGFSTPPSGAPTCEECVAEGCADNYPSPAQGGGMQVHQCTSTAQQSCTTVTDK